MVKAEANRCLECGCKAKDDCKLRNLAEEYKLSPVITKTKQIYYLPDKTHPFIERDPNKCIGCLRCVRVCQEIQGIGALAFQHRVATVQGYQESILNTKCQSCGLCVVNCPVGALTPKKFLSPEREVKTVCPYCGTGCSIYLGVRGNLIVSVKGNREHPINQGNLCVKGRFGWGFINSPERLTKPLIKENGQFIEVSWEEAINFVAKKISKYHGDEFALMSSGKITNEDMFVIQKFARAVMGTNQVDSPACLCHLPTIIGLTESTGNSAMPFPINQLIYSKCIVMAGTNTTENHPIVGFWIKKAVKNGTKLIVIDPRKTELTMKADVHLNLLPGSDVALLMGICRIIVEENLYDKEFIENRTEGFEEFKKVLEEYPIDFVEKVTGINREKIVKAARIIAENTPGAFLYAMGITQHTHGNDNVQALVNIALLTGSYGKLGGGVCPLRGHNNIQGATAFGTLNHLLPGYQYITSPEHREKFEKAWNCKISPDPGLTPREWPDAILQGKIKALYVIGNNPLKSWADSKQTCKAFEQLEFLVVQDLFLTETAQLAHVVLPSVSYAEKDGTFSSLDRRIQRVRKAIEPIGEARPDWQIVCDIAKRMGANGFDYKDVKDIWEEIRSLCPIYTGITYERLEQRDIYFPCPSTDHPGTINLHWKEFARKGGRAIFKPLKYRPPAELPDEEYPFILTTRRYLTQFHYFMRYEHDLQKITDDKPLEINPSDASSLGIKTGDIVRVISRRGEIKVKVKITETCPKGVLALSMHYPETNILTNAALDPIAKIPETKVCAVRIEK